MSKSTVIIPLILNWFCTLVEWVFCKCRLANGGCPPIHGVKQLRSRKPDKICVFEGCNGLSDISSYRDDWVRILWSLACLSPMWVRKRDYQKNASEASLGVVRLQAPVGFVWIWGNPNANVKNSQETLVCPFSLLWRARKLGTLLCRWVSIAYLRMTFDASRERC